MQSIRNWMFAVCVLGTSIAMAQGPPKPGPEHEKLAKQLVGTWDCAVEVAGEKSTAVATYKSICDGMWIVSDFEGTMAGSKFQGHGMDGYDPATKKYVSYWFDSMTPSGLRMEGNFDEKTKQLVMTGDFVNPFGQKEKLKTVADLKDQDHFTFKMFVLGEGNAETQMFNMEYTRKK